jgi:predicted RNA binding protein YcfA (HicA-like mRNA interferase family)
LIRLPRVSGKETVRAQEHGGFIVHRVRGSHTVLRGPTGGDLIVVPVHANRDLPIGTLRSILNQARLSVDDFLELLGK